MYSADFRVAILIRNGDGARRFHRLRVIEVKGRLVPLVYRYLAGVKFLGGHARVGFRRVNRQDEP